MVNSTLERRLASVGNCKLVHHCKLGEKKGTAIMISIGYLCVDELYVEERTLLNKLIQEERREFKRKKKVLSLKKKSV